MNRPKSLLDHLHPNTRPYAVAVLLLVIAPPVVYVMVELVARFFELFM